LALHERSFFQSRDVVRLTGVLQRPGWNPGSGRPRLRHLRGVITLSRNERGCHSNVKGRSKRVRVCFHFVLFFNGVFKESADYVLYRGLISTWVCAFLFSTASRPVSFPATSFYGSNGQVAGRFNTVFIQSGCPSSSWFTGVTGVQSAFFTSAFPSSTASAACRLVLRFPAGARPSIGAVISEFMEASADLLRQVAVVRNFIPAAW